jgi:hypothetical protein
VIDESAVLNELTQEESMLLAAAPWPTPDPRRREQVVQTARRRLKEQAAARTMIAASLAAALLLALGLQMGRKGGFSMFARPGSGTHVPGSAAETLDPRGADALGSRNVGPRQGARNHGDDQDPAWQNVEMSLERYKDDQKKFMMAVGLSM